MSVRVLLFAGARERVKSGCVELELSGPARVADLLSAPALKALRDYPSLRVALNEEFVRADAMVVDGDTVAILPPVSGG